MVVSSLIKTLTARQILDSRGHPTVEVDVCLEDGSFGRAAVPSGASTGRHEAVERRDGNPKLYGGRGVADVCAKIMSTLRPVLVGSSALDQAKIDALLLDLDGTPNKSNLGANGILGVSLAVAKAAAAHEGCPLFRYLGGPGATTLPCPFFNVINGGAHAANPLDIQEFMIAPVGARCFSEALRWGVEVYHSLRSLLKERGLSTNVGDEGGFAPNLSTAHEVLDLLVLACNRAGFEPGRQMAFALDVAASELYDDDDGTYRFSATGEAFSAEALTDYYADLLASYPIVSLEDGMAEDDWRGWSYMTEKLGHKVQLVGDDLFVTSRIRLEEGLKAKAANAVLIKPNQIGTLSETMATIQYAASIGYACMMSHRSGETEDTTIADLTVATSGYGCRQIKAGAPCRTDRVAKYNQLLRIEAELGGQATYAGFSPST